MTNIANRIPTITVPRVTAALVILILGFWILASIPVFAFFSLYLVFVFATIVVVRDGEPAAFPRFWPNTMGVPDPQNRCM
jgi:hypothetical protein